MLGLLAAMAATAWMTALGLLAALVLEAALGLAYRLGACSRPPARRVFLRHGCVTRDMCVTVLNSKPRAYPLIRHKKTA